MLPLALFPQLDRTYTGLQTLGAETVSQQMVGWV